MGRHLATTSGERNATDRIDTLTRTDRADRSGWTDRTDRTDRKNIDCHLNLAFQDTCEGH